MNELDTEKDKVVDYIRTMLGDGMVDVELDPKHYNIAIERALLRYRSRSQNSVEESFGFLTFKNRC